MSLVVRLSNSDNQLHFGANAQLGKVMTRIEDAENLIAAAIY